MHQRFIRVLFCSISSYLFLVNNVSYGADHAGSSSAKYLFDPLLLQSRAQLAHGQVALCHLKLPLDTEWKGAQEMRCLNWHILSMHVDFHDLISLTHFLVSSRMLCRVTPGSMIPSRGGVASSSSEREEMNIQYIHSIILP